MVNTPMELSDGLLMMSWTYHGGFGTQKHFRKRYLCSMTPRVTSIFRAVNSRQVSWMLYLTMLTSALVQERQSIKRVLNNTLSKLSLRAIPMSCSRSCRIEVACGIPASESVDSNCV